MFKKTIILTPILLPNGQNEKDLIGMNLLKAKELILTYNPSFKVELTPEKYQYMASHVKYPDFVRLFYDSKDYKNYSFDSNSVVSRIERY